MNLDIQENYRRGKISIIENKPVLEIEAKEGDIFNMNDLKNTVIHNTPLKFDNSWMVKDVPYSEPSKEEKELLKGTKTINELLEEEKAETAKELTVEEKEEEYRRNYIMMVKVIALYKCKFHPFSNPSDLTADNKKRVIHKMSRVLKNYSEDEIKQEFNEIVNCLLTDSKTDYSTLPIQRN